MLAHRAARLLTIRLMMIAALYSLGSMAVPVAGFAQQTPKVSEVPQTSPETSEVREQAGATGDAEAGGQPRGEEPLAGDGTGRLSTNRYSGRQQATLEMWRRRDLTRDEVQQAARDPDPEVAGRANWILRQWRRGALPGVPADISRRLRNSDDPTSIQELLEVGQFNAAVVAVEESLGLVNRESVQRQLSAVLTRRFPVYVKRALETDSLPALLKLVDLVADSKEMAVCRAQFIQRLDLSLDDLGLLPTAASAWPQAERQAAEVLVLTVLDRLPEAIEKARQIGDQRLLGICQMLAGRWQQMATENAKLAEQAEPDSYEQTQFWSQALIAADRCDQDEIFQRSVAALSQCDPDANRNAAELAWKTLLGHGEADAALSILEAYRPEAAATVALASGRGQRAFATLGLPLEEIHDQKKREAWVAAALATQRGVERPTPEVRSALAMIRCLLSVGDNKAARAVATQMCESYVQVDGIPIREYVLSTLTMTPRRDWVVDLAGDAGEDVFSTITQSTVAGTISTADRMSVEILMDAIGDLKPTLTFKQRLRMVSDLLAGQPTPDFDPALDFKRLFEILATGKREIQQRRGRAVVTPRVRLSMSIAQMFSINGRADLATQCLQYLVDNRDVEATLERAERELDGGRAEEAELLFDLVWSRIEGNGSSRRYRASSDDVDLAAKALVGQWTLARRVGDHLRAQRLYRQLTLTLCSPSTETRSSLADYLGDRGEVGLSMKAYESLLPMAAFGTPGTTVFYQVAWRHMRLASDIDIDRAVRWYDLAASGTLESTDYYRSEAYLTLPLDVRRWALEAAVKRRDEVAAREHLKRILELDPLDIDSAERLLPELREAGMEELADQAFNEIFDRGLLHTQLFPFDATSCNNLAWSAAMNDKRLDEALELSMMAVRVEPDSAIFRDTLAEVLFRLGRTREALQVEESCILDDPSQWHLHQQIDKYRQALEAKSAP